MSGEFGSENIGVVRGGRWHPDVDSLWMMVRHASKNLGSTSGSSISVNQPQNITRGTLDALRNQKSVAADFCEDSL